MSDDTQAIANYLAQRVTNAETEVRRLKRVITDVHHYLGALPTTTPRRTEMLGVLAPDTLDGPRGHHGQG